MSETVNGLVVWLTCMYKLGYQVARFCAHTHVSSLEVVRRKSILAQVGLAMHTR
jgi:hypothetical protein